jgi:hypothetical protein
MRLIARNVLIEACAVAPAHAANADNLPVIVRDRMAVVRAGESYRDAENSLSKSS